MVVKWLAYWTSDQKVSVGGVVEVVLLFPKTRKLIHIISLDQVYKWVLGT